MKKTLIQFVKFSIVGGIGVLINLGLTYALTQFFGLWYLYSNMIGIACAVVSNFAGNKFWTFQEEKK